MTWQLRRANGGDLVAIMALETDIFANDAWSSATMADELDNPQCYYLVAFRPEPAGAGHADIGQPVAGQAAVGLPGAIEAYAGLFAPGGSPEADIRTIAVAAPARRRGLGRVLMLSLMAEARRRGARQVFLEVRADNPAAQRLYASLGFERIAVRAKYYQPDGVDAWVMRTAVPEPRTGPAVGARS